MPCHANGPHDDSKPRFRYVAPDDACAGCPAFCAEACFNDAISRTGAAISIDAERCAGCGGCIGACRHARIILVQGMARLRP